MKYSLKTRIKAIKMKNYYILLFSLFFSYNISSAQEYWKPLDGPTGAYINQIGLDLFGNYYIATNGIKNLFRSTDKGVTWQNFEDGLPEDIHRYGFSFVNAPDSSFYMIVKNQLYVLPPHSSKWRRIVTPNTYGVGIYKAISFNPEGQMYVAKSKMVYRSTDNGESFTPIFESEDEVTLLTNGNNKNFIIQRKSNQNTHLFSFDDNGDNYKEITPSNGAHKGIFYDNYSGKLFTYSYNGLYMSKNDGQSWTNLVDDNTNLSYAVLSPKNIIYGQNHGKMIISEDLGQTWHILPDSIYPVKFEMKNMLFPNDSSILILGNPKWEQYSFNFGIASSDFSSIQEIKTNLHQPLIKDISGDLNGMMYVQTYNNKYLISNNDWQSWKQVNLGNNVEKLASLKHDDKGNFYAISNNRKIYRSIDNGSSWKDITPAFYNPDDYKNFTVSPKGVLYLFSKNDNLFVSDDKGDNWENKLVQLFSSSYYSFYFNSKDYFYYVDWKHIKVSKDKGSTWENIFVSDSVQIRNRVFNITKNNEFIFYAQNYNSSSGYRLYKLENNHLIQLSSNDQIWAIRYIESNISGDIFVGSADGIFKLHHNSNYWEEIFPKLIYYINNVPELFIDRYQYLYAIPLYGKIYKSLKPTTNFHTIQGEVFYDEIVNCKKDDGEIAFYDWEITIKGENEKTTKTDNEGKYSFNLPDGDYTIKINIPEPNSWHSCANNIDFTLNGSQLDTSIISFGIQRITKTENLFNKPKVKIYPHPFSYKTKIIIDDLNLSENPVFSIFNILGTKIFSKKINSNNFYFYRNNISNGIYFYKISSNNKLIGTGKLIIH